MLLSEISKIDEDFGIGVGAPLGADQGIPFGGDGKAVVPCYMGTYSRFGKIDNKPIENNKHKFKRKKKKKTSKLKVFM